jgi:ATP-dependent helicase/DNAse subunit B
MAKSFELYIGSGIRQKAESLIRQCLDHEQAREGQSLVFVVPTHRYALEIMRRQREESPESWRPPGIYPLDRFLRLFLTHNDSNKRILSDEESSFILRQIVMRNQGTFAPIFSRGGEPFPNLIQSALRLIQELKTSGMAPDRLQMPGLENQEGTLIQQLYLQYEEFLKQYRFLDKADILPRALDNLSRGAIQKNLPGIDTLILDGIDVFPRVLIEFLKKIGDFIPKTIVLLEYEDQREPVFKHMDESYHDLSSCAGRIFIIEEESPPTPKANFIQSLYKTDDEMKLPITGMSDFLSIYALPDRLREVTFIAQMIKRLIVQKGKDICLRGICVCFPALELYAPLAREVFDAYGIPFNLSLGLSLSQVPIIRAIDQFLSLAESDFERSALMRFAINPYFSLDEFTNDKHPPSPESMLKHIKSMRVNEGGKTWVDSLKMSMASLSQKISLMEKGEMPLEGDSSRDDLLEEIKNALEEQGRTTSILENLNNTISCLSGERPFSFYSKSIRECIDKLRIRENLMIPPYEGADFSLFQRDIKALGQLFEILDRLDVLSDAFGDHPVSLSQYIEELRNVLNQTDLYSQEIDTDAVQILGRLEPRLFSFRYFILGGFLEGEFPHSPAPFQFLKTKERKQLGLSTNQETLAADRFLFYHFIRQTREQFIIAFPFQKDETPLLPSPMLEEILRISDCSIRSPERDGNPYCEGELQIKLAAEETGKNCAAELKGVYELYAQKEKPHCPPDRCFEILKGIKEKGIPDIRIPTDHRILKNNNFSTSQLEEYGRCPFHYYARRILHLNEPEEMEEELSPLERGELIHRALFRFYRQRAKSQTVPIKTEKEALIATQSLIELAAEEMGRLPYQDLFWEAERERLLGGANPRERPGLLRLFIINELQFFRDNDPGYIPEFFEVAFGRVPGTESEHDPLSSMKPFQIDHPGGPIYLRGKVDRVEVCGDFFAVVDYKTGSSLPTIHDLKDGTSLQLAVYLLAIKEKLKALYKRNVTPAGGIFYQINREDRIKRDSQIILKSQRRQLLGSERKRTFCENEEEMERYLEMARGHVKSHVTGIRNGSFPLSPLNPENALCGSCAFRLSCRRRIGKMFRRR